MRVVHAVSFFVALCAMQALAADVVALRDGSRRTGRLVGCADDSCRLSGDSIAMTKIAAIFLDSDGKAAPAIPATPNVVVMRDGSIRPGVVTFLNLGTVEIGDEEVDRSDVAVIVFAANADIVILRDRSSIRGTLRLCNAVTCTVDASSIPLAGIEWIGLGREGALPPAATSPASDELHRSDGTVSKGRLSGITATSVTTRRGTFTRAETAWIHLAPPADDSDQPDRIGAPPDPAEPPPEKPVKEPRKEKVTPPPPVRPPVKPPGKPPGISEPADMELTEELWIGRVHGEVRATADGEFSQYTIRIQVRLSGPAFPVFGSGLRTVGYHSRLSGEGTKADITYHDSRGCSDRWNATDFGRGEVIYRTVDEPVRQNIYSQALDKLEVPKEGLYTLMFVPDYSHDECSATEHGFGLYVGIGGREEEHNKTKVPEMRLLTGNRSRMSGSYTQTRSWKGPPAGTIRRQVSWEICRSGSAGCTMPPPEFGERETPEDDDCLELARLLAGLKSLLEAAQSHHASYKESVAKRDAARDVMFGPSGAIAKFVVSLEGLLSEGVEGKLGDLLGLATAGAGMAQNFDNDTVMQAVGEIASTDAAFAPAEALAIRNAIKAAQKYVAETNDLDGSLRIYAGHIGRSEVLAVKGKKIVKGFSVASAVLDFTDMTIELADAVQDFDLHRSEANSHKINMDDADNRMEELNDEIAEVRRRLKGPCPGIPSTEEVPAPSDVAQKLHPAGASELQVTAAEVRQIVENLAEVEPRLAKAVPWLLPFLARMTSGVDPGFLAGLLQQAEPDLRAAGVEIEKATKAARQLESRMKAEDDPSPRASREP